MKKPFRLIAALLALCVLTASLPPVTIAAEGAAEAELPGLIDAANANGTVDLGGATVRLNDTSSGGSKDAPYAVNKPVTIQNGTIDVWAGGFVLDADVTFSNVTLKFSTTVGNYIVANGHTLTLNGVSCEGKSFNIYGGTITGTYANFPIPNPGSNSEIIISGNTGLQGSMGNGNIYAGNLFRSTDGQNPTKQFDGNVTISVDGAVSTGALGAIYACGAEQNGSTATANPNYTINGTVAVSGAKIPDVYGRGSTATNVSYRGDGYQATRTFADISRLDVESGNLALTGSSYFRNNGVLSVASGAMLDLRSADAANLNIHDFTGNGGFLFLAPDQTFNMSGQVSGTTKLAIGGTNSGNTGSLRPSTSGHIYIHAPNSGNNAFELLPYDTQPNMTLVNDSGNWTASDGSSSGGDQIIVESFRFNQTSVAEPSGTKEAIIPLVVEYADHSAFPSYLDFVPLDIEVNGKASVRTEEDGTFTYTLTGANLLLQVYEDELTIWEATNAPIPDGTYEIALKVPAQFSAMGTPLTSTVKLTIGDAPDPGITQISVPTANTGLKWTGSEQTGVAEGEGYTLTGHKGTDVGSYTAAATLKPGYQWADGSEDPKTIPWSIARADGPAAPRNLAGVAPTAAGGTDGKITGTTAQMEYATTAAFTDAQDCGQGETTGLAARTYYVRVKGTDTHEPGASTSITVPAPGAPTVTGIVIKTPAAKTEYQVGEALDVTGLTIEAVYSDQTTQVVTVTADMVSGFHSAQAAESLTLTITYEGRTAAYTVKITPAPPAPGHKHTWSSAWSASGTHHWHNCTAFGCSITADSAKDGYAAHTAGSWIVDRPATSWQSGTRHRACTVCGYVMEQQTIPATGGSSSGGSSSGGGSSGGSSSSSGSTTTTTRNPDGSQTVVVTQKNGTVTTTEKAADGSTVKTVQKPDGSSETSIRRADGAAAEISTDRLGRTEAQVDLPARIVNEAQTTGRPVVLPLLEMPVSTSDSATVVVRTNSAQPVKVEIPASITAGTVAVIVNKDGSELVLRTSSLTDNGIIATVPDGAAVKLVDNRIDFFDTQTHWAKDAVAFVSARELFFGTSAATFAPDAPMTRAMAAAVLARLDGMYISGGSSWHENSVAWAVSRGISDGQDPGRDITREQLISMLYRYAGSPSATDRQLHFYDADAVSGYAQEAMCWAVENGILSGCADGSLAPGSKATRAQVAVILRRYIELLSR